MKPNRLEWRDRFGNRFMLTQMETRYLYHVVKCIWNNVLGVGNTFGEVIEWKFNSDDYPFTYLKDIFAEGFKLLQQREDTNHQMRKFMDHVDRGLRVKFDTTVRGVVHELQVEQIRLAEDDDLPF